MRPTEAFKQGDQIGRIFAFYAIVYFGQIIWKNCIVITYDCATFFKR
jgi:hypothetical protein